MCCFWEIKLEFVFWVGWFVGEIWELKLWVYGEIERDGEIMDYCIRRIFVFCGGWDGFLNFVVILFLVLGGVKYFGVGVVK